MWYVRKDSSGRCIAVVAGPRLVDAVIDDDSPLVFDCRRVSMSSDLDLVLWELVRAHNIVVGELR